MTSSFYVDGKYEKCVVCGDVVNAYDFCKQSEYKFKQSTIDNLCDIHTRQILKCVWEFLYGEEV